jgi:hypothetical protein
VFPSPLNAARNTAIATKIVQWPGWAPSASKGGGPAILRIG